MAESEEDVVKLRRAGVWAAVLVLSSSSEQNGD